MPYCHKCQHNGKHSQACLTCKGYSDKPNHHGQNITSIDSHGDAENILDQTSKDYLQTISTPRADTVTPLPPVAEHYALELLREIAAIPYNALPILHGLLNDQSFDQIAETHGITKQLVSYRYGAALKYAPALANLMHHHQGKERALEARLKRELKAGKLLRAKEPAKRNQPLV